MDCQSEYPLKALFFVFPKGQPGFGVPCPGQCLNAGMDGSFSATKILDPAINAAIPVWPNECNLQKAHPRAQSLQMNSAVAPSQGRR